MAALGTLPGHILLASGQLCLELHLLFLQCLNLKVSGDGLLGHLSDLGVPAGFESSCFFTEPGWKTGDAVCLPLTTPPALPLLHISSPRNTRAHVPPGPRQRFCPEEGPASQPSCQVSLSTVCRDVSYRAAHWRWPCQATASLQP